LLTSYHTASTAASSQAQVASREHGVSDAAELTIRRRAKLNPGRAQHIHQHQLSDAKPSTLAGYDATDLVVTLVRSPSDNRPLYFHVRFVSGQPLVTHAAAAAGHRRTEGTASAPAAAAAGHRTEVGTANASLDDDCTGGRSGPGPGKKARTSRPHLQTESLNPVAESLLKLRDNSSATSGGSDGGKRSEACVDDGTTSSS